MSQENEATPLNTEQLSLSTDGCHHQKCNTWLTTLCTELGFNNLAFLANYSPPGPLAGVPDEDSVDGCIGVTGHRIIKAVVTVLLEHLIDKRMKKECAGCEVDHPSQTRHSCLFEPAPYYFYGCYDEISQKLLKPELKNILANTLKPFGLTPHLQRIQGTVESVLCDLRDEIYIVEELASMRQKLVDESCEEVIYNAVDNWKLAAEAAAAVVDSTC